MVTFLYGNSPMRNAEVLYAIDLVPHTPGGMVLAAVQIACTMCGKRLRVGGDNRGAPRL